MKRFLIGTMLAGGAIVVACGGGGSVVTSVTGTKTVASLTTAEKTSACQDANNYVKANVSKAESARIGCSIEIAKVGAACSAQLIDVCTQASQEEATVAQQDCSMPPDTTNCGTITVDDYSACVKEQVAAAKAIIGQGCSAKEPNLTAGPACSKVRAACPQIVYSPG